MLLEKLKVVPFDKTNTVVIALPRGGVPVALEIAQGLNLPLDIVLVKKIGLPSSPELAIGAVCEGNEVYYSEELMKYFNYDLVDMEPYKLRAVEELQNLSIALRGGRQLLPLENKDIILVDDGIATGATMEVVIQLLKKKKVGKIIIAVPVASPENLQKLLTQTYKTISVISPQFLSSVGQWYEAFGQVETDEVRKILDQYSMKRISPISENESLRV